MAFPTQVIVVLIRTLKPRATNWKHATHIATNAYMYDLLYVCVVIKIGFCFLIKRLQLLIFFFKYVDIELLLTRWML